MAHNSKNGPSTDWVGHRRPIIQRGNKTSVGTAEPRFRRDILDQDNGGVNDIGIGPGNGSAPGANGRPVAPGISPGGYPGMS
jgi:hypothetical protein